MSLKFRFRQGGIGYAKVASLRGPAAANHDVAWECCCKPGPDVPFECKMKILRPDRKDSNGRLTLGRSGPDGERRHSPLILISMALAVYVAVLWLGIVVIGDTALHSALVGAVILAIAITGYIVNGRDQQTRDKKP